VKEVRVVKSVQVPEGKFCRELSLVDGKLTECRFWYYTKQNEYWCKLFETVVSGFYKCEQCVGATTDKPVEVANAKYDLSGFNTRYHD